MRHNVCVPVPVSVCVLPADSLRRTPLSPQAKVRVMELLLRSPAAAALLPHNLQIILDGWFNPVTTPKLQLATSRFASYVFTVAPAEALVKLSPLFLQGDRPCVRLQLCACACE